jgi:hypothetical protein
VRKAKSKSKDSALMNIPAQHQARKPCLVTQTSLTISTLRVDWIGAGYFRYKFHRRVPARRKRRQKGNTVSDETVKYSYWDQ